MICYLIGGDFPPPPLLRQLLNQEKQGGYEAQKSGGEVHQVVGLGLAAFLFPLAIPALLCYHGGGPGSKASPAPPLCVG